MIWLTGVAWTFPKRKFCLHFWQKQEDSCRDFLTYRTTALEELASRPGTDGDPFPLYLEELQALQPTIPLDTQSRIAPERITEITKPPRTTCTGVLLPPTLPNPSPTDRPNLRPTYAPTPSPVVPTKSPVTTANPYIYCRSETEMNYVDHFFVAGDLGGNLAVVGTMELDNVITDLAMSVPGNGAWIGLNDIMMEGNFVWVDEETEFVYSGFGAGEPSSLTNAHDCVELNNFEWAVASCDRAKYAIYQFPAVILDEVDPAELAEQAIAVGITACVDAEGDLVFTA